MNLGIVANLLGQVFPAHRSIASEIAAPSSTRDNQEGALAQNHSGGAADRAPDIISYDKLGQGIVHSNVVVPDTVFDSANVSDLQEASDHWKMTGEDVRDTEMHAAGDGSDDSS